MSKGYSFVIPYGIYEPFDLFVSIGHNDEKLRKILRKRTLKKFHSEIDDLLGPDTAVTMMFKSGETVMRFRDSPADNPGLIAHEALHAACFLLKRVGVNFSTDSDEAFAYLLEYIVNKIIENIKIHEKAI